MSDADPHRGAEVVSGGAELESAKAVAIGLHGRGATARGMLDLLDQADRSDGQTAHLAPQATRRTWYPRSFLEPIAVNQPHLDSALEVVDRVVGRAADRVGREGVLLVGFSQGACLASEYLGRADDRLGGLVAFSGGLIGETVERDRYRAHLDGTPVYLGCSDVDPHIPESRVHETATVLDRSGAEVTTEIFPGMGHTVNDAELEALSARLDALVG